MRISGAASSALAPLLQGPPRAARLLGSGPRAVYLSAGKQVVALLSTEAVRLPCALVLPGPLAGPVAGVTGLTGLTVGGGAVRWSGTATDTAVVITAARYWRPARVGGTTPDAAGLRAALRGCETGVDEMLVEALGADGADDTAAVPAVRALLGRGPGLTPAGDDVLAGFLLGARAFGLAAGSVRRAVALHAPGATTLLSAQLLRHALAGDCVPEVVGALERGEVRALLRVGHTSGAALARGLLRAVDLRESHAAAA